MPTQKMNQILGLDCLGLAKFGTAINALPGGFALGVFSREFGNSLPAVKEVVKAGKCTALRVQLMWSEKHSYSDADIPTLIDEAKRWGNFAANNPGLPVYLSPFCEHKLAQPDKYLEIVRKHAPAPNCKPVNSFSPEGQRSMKFINEVHGTQAAPGGEYFYSFDGLDMLDSDISRIMNNHKKALIFFAWTANFNGRREAAFKGRTDWPSDKLISSIWYVTNNAKGNARLPNQWFWQSHAEDLSNDDARTNKPVLGTPLKANLVELVQGNKVISSAKRYPATLRDGRSRFYFPQWGFELAKQGGGVLDVRCDGKIYGKVNPAFCEGTAPLF